MNCRFVYLTHNPPSNVVFSQVVELVEVLSRHQIDFDLVFLLSGSNYLRYRRRQLEGMAQIRQRLHGRVTCLPTPLLNRPAGLAWAARLLAWRYPAARQERLVIHARNLTSACIAARLKARRPDVRILFDVRGDKLSEFLFLNPDLAADPEHREDHSQEILQRERYASGNADQLFCVSGVLRDLVAGRTGYDRERIAVIPCCADDRLFHYDATARERLRTRLQLQDRFVLIYSGGMTKWHCPDRVFAVAAALMQEHADLMLLVLTPDHVRAGEMAAATLPAGRWMVTKAGREEVSDYLSAADLGMLVREDDPLNRVASPTKFAEYVMAGLPVMISDHIGDYSDFVEAHGCGFVLPDDLAPGKVQRRFNAYRALAGQDRESIATLGRTHFSKERYMPEILGIYHRLCRS